MIGPYEFEPLKQAVQNVTMIYISMNIRSMGFEAENEQLRNIWAECNQTERELIIARYIAQILEG